MYTRFEQLGDDKRGLSILLMHWRVVNCIGVVLPGLAIGGQNLN